VERYPLINSTALQILTMAHML